MKTLLKAVLAVAIIAAVFGIPNVIADWTNTLPSDLLSIVGGVALFLGVGFFITVIFGIIALALEAAQGGDN